jgi:diguanylate cyclase (GGDEF)-like protein
MPCQIASHFRRVLSAFLLWGMLVSCAVADDLAAELRETALQRDISTDEALIQLDRLRPQLTLAEPALQCEYLAQRAEILIEGGYMQEADTAIGRLLSAAETADDEAGRLRALVLRARLGYFRGDAVLQMSSASEAITLARQLPGNPWSVRAFENLGIAMFVASRYEESARTLQEALVQAQKFNSPILVGRIYLALSALNIHIGDNARALQYVNEGRKLVEPTRERWLLAQIESNAGLVSGRPEEGSEDYATLQRALIMARSYGVRRTELAALTNLADWYLIHHDWQKAIASAREAVALSSRFDDRAFTGMGLLYLGQGLIGAGRGDEGVAMLERARDRVRESGDQYHLSSVLTQLAIGYEKTGRLVEALAAQKAFYAAHENVDREGRSRLLAELQERFDTANRQREILRLEVQSTTQAESARRQRQLALFWSVVAAVLLLGVGAVLAFHRSTRRANRQLAAANEQLAYLAERDTLTGLLNRRAMTAWIETVQPRPSVGTPIGLVLIDIDHFKSVNDRLGHAGGDAVLVEFAKRLSQLLRDADRLSRWGGEEFLIGVRGVEAYQLPGLAQRILDAISEAPFVLPSGPIMVTASIGYVSYPVAFGAIEEGWEHHLTLADQALYMAKAEGRNAAFGITGGRGEWETLREVVKRDFVGAFSSEALFTSRYRGREGENIRVNPDARHGHPGAGRIIPFPHRPEET